MSDAAVPSDTDLLELADAVASRAYAPYSHFDVGCAVLTRDSTPCTWKRATARAIPEHGLPPRYLHWTTEGRQARS